MLFNSDELGLTLVWDFGFLSDFDDLELVLRNDGLDILGLLKKLLVLNLDGLESLQSMFLRSLIQIDVRELLLVDFDFDVDFLLLVAVHSPVNATTNR